MALPYIIDFTDPLKASFSIPVSGFNGPGGTQANTTLRLYGRGALDWGEAVDEDLVRLTENFSSASSPLNPIDGQLWREVRLYWHDTTAGTHAGWYVYNPNTNLWALINGTGIVANSPASPTLGNVYYDSALETLYLYESRYRQQAAAFFERSFSSDVVPPGVTPPETFFQVYSEGTQSWLYLNPSIVTDVEPADGIQAGQLWYDPSTNILYVYSGTAWENVGISGADFDLGGFDITGLSTQTYPLPDSNTAATINYVNDGLAAVVAGSNVGGIGALGSGIVVKTGAGTYAARSLDEGTGILITNPNGVAADPIIAVDTTVIATQAYVDSAVAGITGGTVTVEPIAAGVPSNGIGNNGDLRYQY